LCQVTQLPAPLSGELPWLHNIFYQISPSSPIILSLPAVSLSNLSKDLTTRT